MENSKNKKNKYYTGGVTINTGSEVIVTGNIPDDNDAFNTGLQLKGTTTTTRDLYIDFFSQKLLALTRA